MTLAMKLRETLEEGKAQGFSEGKALGLTQGEDLKRISLIRKKYMKKISAEETADMLEESVTVVMAVMELLNTNTDMSDEEVYQKLNSQLLGSNKK